MAGTKGRSGGKREGAGRPRQIKTISDKAIEAWAAAGRKIKKETGESVEYQALKIFLDPNEPVTLRKAALEAYQSSLVIKKPENKTETHNYPGPAIMLPPNNEDPALKIVE